MFFETTIFYARLVSHGKNSSTKEASSSDGEESLSKIFSKKFAHSFVEAILGVVLTTTSSRSKDYCPKKQLTTQLRDREVKW